MKDEIILTYENGRLKVLSSCPECGGKLVARTLGVPSDYLGVECVTVSNKHTGSGWRRALKQWSDTGIPYRII